MYSKTPSLDSSFLRSEVLGLVKDLAVPVPKYVGGKPAIHSQHSGLEHRSDNGLYKSLASLEILAAYGHSLVSGQPLKRWNIHSQVRTPVDKGNTLQQGGVGVDHRGSDVLAIVVKPTNETFDILMDFGFSNEFFGRSAPNHNQTIAIIVLLEPLDIVS